MSAPGGASVPIFVRPARPTLETPPGPANPRLRIAAIGQFPPPVNGFSLITERVTALAAGRHAVVRFDIAPDPAKSGVGKHLHRFRAAARACARLLRMRTAGGVVSYIACEGRLGLVYTLAMVVAARARGHRLYLHHHNYTYVDRFSGLMWAIDRVLGDGAHVFLCAIMRHDFEGRYGPVRNGIVLSNAAFVAPGTGRPEHTPDAPLVLGHLSNLTREKGLHLFLAVIEQAVAGGRDVRAVLAGPVAKPEDRRAIEETQARLGGRLEYLGPLYGADKDRFYRDIDVFVFPTAYANEAQPTVVFEALAAGAKVLSFDRACIRNQIGDDGLVVPKDGDFVAAALAWIDRDGPGARADRAATVDRFRATHAAAFRVAERLFEDGGAPGDR